MDENPYRAPVGAMASPHSPFGIASFFLACSMAVLFLVLLGVSELIDARQAPESLETFFSIAAVLFFLGNLVAVVLGIIGLLQKGRKKLLGGIGVALSCALVGSLILIAVYDEPRPLGGPMEIHLRRTD